MQTNSTPTTARERAKAMLAEAAAEMNNYNIYALVLALTTYTPGELRRDLMQCYMDLSEYEAERLSTGESTDTNATAMLSLRRMIEALDQMEAEAPHVYEVRVITAADERGEA